MSSESLRDLVAARVATNWDQFAERHPALAASVERVQFIDATVRHIADDPEYQRAMELAGMDEAVLGATSRVVPLVERWVVRMLGL
jgi:hypothetical protein